MTQSKIIGDLHTTIHGCEIRKAITGHAYARNGNSYNPTAQVLWVVYKDGINQGCNSKLADAKELAKMVAEEVN